MIIHRNTMPWLLQDRFYLFKETKDLDKYLYLFESYTRVYNHFCNMQEHKYFYMLREAQEVLPQAMCISIPYIFYDNKLVTDLVTYKDICIHRCLHGIIQHFDQYDNFFDGLERIYNEL